MSSDPTSLYSRKNPFPATHPVNRKLSGEGSGKDTRHHEISLAGSGLHYEVGDSMGLFATNDPALAEEIIKALGATGEEEVPGSDGGGKDVMSASVENEQRGVGPVDRNICINVIVDQLKWHRGFSSSADY